MKNLWEFENITIIWFCIEKRINKFQKDLLLFLLNGASDETDSVREKAIQILERHGNDMKEALIQLGEEKENGDEDEENKDWEMESATNE